jgi:hypothetical protein
VTSYAVIAVLTATVMLLAASVRVHRYSRGHMTARATLAGHVRTVSFH